MSTITANGINLEYETFGNPADPAIVLVIGFGLQLTGWPDAFCEGLAARGFHVVRFDNRDTRDGTKDGGGGRHGTLHTC